MEPQTPSFEKMLVPRGQCFRVEGGDFGYNFLQVYCRYANSKKAKGKGYTLTVWPVKARIEGKKLITEQRSRDVRVYKLEASEKYNEQGHDNVWWATFSEGGKYRKKLDHAKAVVMKQCGLEYALQS